MAEKVQMMSSVVIEVMNFAAEVMNVKKIQLEVVIEMLNVMNCHHVNVECDELSP